MIYIEPDFKNKIIDKGKELIETDKDAQDALRIIISFQLYQK